jgi:hypothetical protein
MGRFIDPDVPVGVGGASVINIPPRRWLPWVTPVLDTSAYVAGDTLHITPMRINGFVLPPNFQTTIVGLVVEDTTGTPQNAGLTAWIFDRPEIVVPTINAAWTLTAPDRDKRVACVSSGPYNTSTATGVSENFTLNVPVRNRYSDPDGALWVLLQTLGAPTYAASSLRLQFVVQD